MIPTPSNARLGVIQEVFDGLKDPDELSDWEFAWMQDRAMQSIISKLAETNLLVFSDVEDGLIN